MNCDVARPLLSAYQDGELDANRRAEIEDHLKTCPACTGILARNARLSEAIRAQAPTYQAPESLKSGPLKKAPWLTFGSGIVAGLAVAAACLMLFVNLHGHDMTDELVGDHARSLMASHLFDVPSSDRHTVKPWFLGKIDFAPTVPDLATNGFPLVGGRLDYVAGHPAAALVYMRAKHVINVLVLPARYGLTATGERDGYRVEHWRTADLDYWAVSDVAADDLKTFEEAFKKAQ